MCEWKEKPLSDLAILYNDSWKVGDEECPYIALEHIEEGKLRLNGIGYSDSVASNKYRFNEKNFLFGKLRPYFRKVVRPQFSGICSTDIWVVGARGETDLTFMFYLFANQEFVDLAYSGSSGTRMPRADWKFMKDTVWLIPLDIEEQRAIASVLSSLDDKIDLLHRQNKTLEAMAETLFRQWFVEPIIQAEIDGSKAVGFQNGKFDKWIETTLGGDWGKENPIGYFVVPVYCIRGTDIANLNTGIPGKTPVRHVKKKKFENIEPKEGDIIIEISGGTENQSTGRTTYINSDIKSLFQLPLVFSNFCRLLKIKKEEYSFFVYLYLQFLYKQDEFFNLENGSSGIKNLDYKALLFELDYPMPQESMVVEFDEEVKDYFKKINQNKSQIRTLEKLRDTLLPKLMSGEVRVKLEQQEAGV